MKLIAGTTGTLLVCMLIWLTAVEVKGEQADLPPTPDAAVSAMTVSPAVRVEPPDGDPPIPDQQWYALLMLSLAVISLYTSLRSRRRS